jgi:DNA-binding phage protein
MAGFDAIIIVGFPPPCGEIQIDTAKARTMTLARDFKATVQARAKRESAFAQALFTEGVQLLTEGDVAAGRLVLCDYINATLGFEKLAAATKTSPKSLMRMFSGSGNPTANNLFAVISALQAKTGTVIEVRGRKKAA